MAKVSQPTMEAAARTLTVEVTGRTMIGTRTLELRLAKPAGFSFIPGQRIRFIHEGIERDYSLVSAPSDPELVLCIRVVEAGALTPLLASAEPGDRFSFNGPGGYFIFQPSPRPAVFVATGTGIAPFVSMARSGVTGFILLHGVTSPEEQCYADVMKKAAGRYVPCFSRPSANAVLPEGSFKGHVTDWLRSELPSGGYDFYLCGRTDMIRDATLLIDERFPESLVHTEIFY